MPPFSKYQVKYRSGDTLYAETASASALQCHGTCKPRQVLVIAYVFDNIMSWSNPDKDQKPVYRRVAPRQNIEVMARLRVLSTPYDVQLLDLSSTGFRFESVYQFAEGARCTLKIDTFETFGANVVWMRSGIAGCLFERPLHPSVVDAIAARHPGLGCMISKPD